MSAVVASGFVGVSAAVAAVPASQRVRIVTLANRADLISGSSTLVQIVLPSAADRRSVRVTLRGKNVTKEFAGRADGAFEGLLSKLVVGENLVKVTLADGYGAKLTITDHPIGGPVFSGPQHEPWVCEKGALDKACNEPPHYSYLYESTNPKYQGLQPYDLADPPTGVATTTTSDGVKVPFIVREETGYEDRDAYRIEVLWQPRKTWSPFAPQPQWNHELYVTHGYDCETDNGVSSPPWGDGLSTLGLPSVPGIEDSSQVALGMGFAVMSTALDNSAVDCDVALQAESVLMAKEHLIDDYGTIKYTIGYGCSGGSLAVQTISNAYPGIYNGLIVQCSFPDADSTIQQIADYYLTGNYFGINGGPLPDGLSGAIGGTLGTQEWTGAQIADIEGTGVENLPLPFDNAFSENAFYSFGSPYNCSQVTAAQEYNTKTNPGGVRCGILDWQINLLGPEPKSAWNAQEKAAGHGFGGIPLGNVGVQYGLDALEKKEITPSQFAALNAYIGGVNIDLGYQTQRTAPDLAALRNAYRTGEINEANNLTLPIIDTRGPNDPGLAHDSFRTFAVTARLQQQHGTSANQVVWEGPAPIIGDFQYTKLALEAMNTWVARIYGDHSDKPYAKKVIDDKPASIHQQCSDGDGLILTHTLCPSAVVPVYGTPRTVAGESISTYQNQCQLEPLTRSSYDVSFTTAEWALLEKAFPTGVCDYAKPGVGQQPTIPWLTYQTASGKVIYGGRPLGPAPASLTFGPR
jgi:hypothetical protein